LWPSSLVRRWHRAPPCRALGTANPEYAESGFRASENADAGTVDRLAAMGQLRSASALLTRPSHVICAATVAMILCAGESVYGRNLAAFMARDTMLLRKAG